MTVQDGALPHALAAIEFVVNRRGETQGVFLPLEAWEAVLDALESIEDLDIARDYLIRRIQARSPKEMALLRWEDVADEWNDDPTTES